MGTGTKLRAVIDAKRSNIATEPETVDGHVMAATRLASHCFFSASLSEGDIITASH